MQCAACRAVYSNSLGACPRCKRPADLPGPVHENAADMTNTFEETVADAADAAEAQAEEPKASGAGSTLIEFPGARSLPQWRKELSERVREIQQRKAREAALEAELAGEAAPAGAQSARQEASDAQTREGAQADAAHASPTHLGLVPPPPEAPEMNPLVAAALARVERARQQYPPPPGPRGGAGRRAAATAVARAAEERYEPRAQTQARSRQEPRHETRVVPALQQAGAAPAPEELKQPQVSAEPSRATEAPRTTGLAVVPPPAADQKPPAEQKISAEQKPAAQTRRRRESAPAAEQRTEAAQPSSEPAPAVPAVSELPAVGTTMPAAAAAVAQTTEAEADSKPKPRRVVEGVVDDAWLSRLEERILPPVNAAARRADDVAPLVPRVAAGLLDLLLVTFLSSPFAAVIELTNGNWGDPRVAASMAGIVVVVLFLYETVSTALAGRTFAMSLFRLRSVDAETALAPTTGQCVRRTLLYLLSLVTLGIGVLYALFDAERRAAHDHLSGTVVVRDQV